MKNPVNFNIIFKYGNGDHSSVNLFISDGSMPVYILRHSYYSFLIYFNDKIKNILL